MKYAFAFLVAFFALCAPAAAQWQTPNHSVPVGRGSGATGFNSAVPGAAGTAVVSNGATSDPSFGVVGVNGGGTGCAVASGTCLDNITGFSGTGYARRTGPGAYAFDATVPTSRGGTGLDNSASATNEVLAYNGSGFLHTAFTSVINAACTVAPTPCAYLFGYWRPEWFGAVCSPNGTAAGSIADSAAAVQSAVGAVASNAGGVVKFASCAYKITVAINISASNTAITGTGVNATTIVWSPSGASPAFNFSAGAGLLSNVGVSDLSILSPDTTTTKIGILLSDVSEPWIRNVNMAHYPIDGTLFRGGSGSVGIQTAGRELGKIENVQLYVEKPIEIGVNANAPNTGEDMDSWIWNNVIMVGQISGVTCTCTPSFHLITVDAGVSFFNTKFIGHQNWVGGVDGFHWVGVVSVASQGLEISGVKDEQAGLSSGYTFNIQPSSLTFNLDIRDSGGGGRNFIFLRNTVNTRISSMLYALGGSNVGLNADLTNLSITFSGNAWVSGTTATLGAFTNSNWITPTGYSTALPASGVSWH
jgi:hypothetical protein